MKLVTKLTKVEAKRVMGMDASTNGVGFCIFDGDTPVKWGKINFKGADVFEKIKDAGDKINSFMDSEKVDYICIESAIMARSAGTAIKLGYVFGALLYVVMGPDTKVHVVPPITWQSYIGNKNYTKAQKEAVKKVNPSRSDTWIRNRIREERKQFTLDYFNNKYGITLTDNDVGDAFGIAYYTIRNLTHE